MSAPTPTRIPPLRPRGRPKKTAEARDDGNRRQALLKAAGQLFCRQGFAATSTRDIAAAAGMRSGSPFYHFENKQALLAEVMREGMRRALRQQGEALARLGEGATDADRLQALVRHHFEVLLGTESDFIPVMLYEWRSLDPTQAGEIKALKASYEATWVPVLQGLHDAGRLAGDVGLARLLIMGALNWSVQWYQAPPAEGGEFGARERRADLDELTAAALRLFLKAPF